MKRLKRKKYFTLLRNGGAIHILHQLEEEILIESDLIKSRDLLNLLVNVIPSFVHVCCRVLLQVHCIVDSLHFLDAFRLGLAVALLQGRKLGRVGSLLG